MSDVRCGSDWFVLDGVGAVDFLAVLRVSLADLRLSARSPPLASPTSQCLYGE